MSMLLDHFIMILIIVPPMFLLVFLGVNKMVDVDPGVGLIIFFSLISIYLNKDFLKGKSPAKRIMGYQVVDNKTKKPATELQCFVRNLTICIAWPIEVIIGFINPERRIGDFMANTKVVVSEKEKLKTILTELKEIKLKTNIVGIAIIAVIYFYGLSFIIPGIR